MRGKRLFGISRSCLGSVAILSASCLFLNVTTPPAEAHDFTGQTIRMVVDFRPGGGTDIQARYFANNWGKFIPGSPRIVVTNMFPNPSGKNFVYRSKPDGLTLNFVASASVGREFIDSTANFQTERFVSIGGHAKRDIVLLARGTVPYNSLKESRGSSVEIVLAEPIGGPGDLDGKLLGIGMLAMWLDAPLRIATVARAGTADTLLMLERGDVNGYLAGSQWYAMPQLRPGWFSGGFLKPIANLGHPETPTVPNSEISMTVPNAYEWLTPEQKKIWEALILPEVITGKGIIAPPDMPANITSTLRRSYEAALKDPAFADGLVAIQGQPIDYMSGERMQVMIAEANEAFKNYLPELENMRQEVFNRYFRDASAPTVPDHFSGVVSDVLDNGGSINIAGHNVRLHSSNSKITVGGNSIQRTEMKAGLQCSIVGATRRGRYEAQTVTCN